MQVWPTHKTRRGFTRSQHIASARRMLSAGLERYLSAAERRLLKEAEDEKEPDKWQ